MKSSTRGVKSPQRSSLSLGRTSKYDKILKSLLALSFIIVVASTARLMVYFKVSILQLPLMMRFVSFASKVQSTPIIKQPKSYIDLLIKWQSSDASRTGLSTLAAYWRPLPGSSSSASFAKPRIEWGSYRPDIYFGLKCRWLDSPPLGATSISTGILWWKDQDLDAMRHQTKQDQLRRFEWLRHNGRDYGEQELEDLELNVRLLARFYLPFSAAQDSSTPALAWVQRVEVSALNESLPAALSQSRTHVFYAGLDSFGEGSPASAARILSIGGNRAVGHTQATGYFLLQVRSYHKFPETSGPRDARSISSDWELYMVPHDVASGITQLRTRTGERLEAGSLGNFIYVKVTQHGKMMNYPWEMEVMMTTGYAADSLEELAVRLQSIDTPFPDYHQLMQERVQEFDSRFMQVYGLSSSSSSAASSSSDELSVASDADASLERSVGKRALSSLLGGIGSFVGRPRLANGLDVSSNGQPAFMRPDQVTPGVS
jgi:hypothetical protein